jgi:hypothetical protein
MCQPVAKRHPDSAASNSPRHTSRGVRPAPAILGAAFAFAITFSVFWPTVRNQFVDWDDQATITDNLNFRGLKPAHLQWMFTTFHTGHWQPLSWVTLAIDSMVARSLYGNPIDPQPYHLTNNILHALNAMLFYFLGLRLLGRSQKSEVRGHHDRLQASRVHLMVASLIAALVFALHPLRVESVAWATERRDVLSAFFFLATLMAYLKAVAPMHPQSPTQSRRWLGASIALAVLCLLSKSIGVVLPAIMLLLDVYPLRRLSLRQRDLLSRQTLGLIVEKIPFIILAIIGSVIAVNAQRAAGAMLDASQLGTGHRMYVMMHGFAYYIAKTLGPWNLSPLVEIPYNFSLRDGSFVLSAAFVLLITAVAVAISRRCPGILAAWCGYLIIVLPVSGLIQSGPQLAADRYSYLSCMGLALLAGGAMLGLLSFLARRSDRPMRQAFACGFALAIIVALALLTRSQIAIWRDTFTLWTAAIERRPNTSLAYMNRGVAYIGLNDFVRAQADLARAVELWPNDARSRRNLGFALLSLDRIDEAVAHYREAFHLDPSDWTVQASLIDGLAARDRVPLAIEVAGEAAQLRPDVPELQALFERLRTQPQPR